MRIRLYTEFRVIWIQYIIWIVLNRWCTFNTWPLKLIIINICATTVASIASSMQMVIKLRISWIRMRSLTLIIFYKYILFTYKILIINRQISILNNCFSSTFLSINWYQIRMWLYPIKCPLFTWLPWWRPPLASFISCN